MNLAVFEHPDQFHYDAPDKKNIQLLPGLAQVGAQESVKRMVTGAVIIIAVIVDFYRTRRAEAKSRAASAG